MALGEDGASNWLFRSQPCQQLPHTLEALGVAQAADHTAVVVVRFRIAGVRAFLNVPQAKLVKFRGLFQVAVGFVD